VDNRVSLVSATQEAMSKPAVPPINTAAAAQASPRGKTPASQVTESVISIEPKKTTQWTAEDESAGLETKLKFDAPTHRYQFFYSMVSSHLNRPLGLRKKSSRQVAQRNPY
jgi:hypothetical protein